HTLLLSARQATRAVVCALGQTDPVEAAHRLLAHVGGERARSPRLPEGETAECTRADILEDGQLGDELNLLEDHRELGDALAAPPLPARHAHAPGIEVGQADETAKHGRLT